MPAALAGRVPRIVEKDDRYFPSFLPGFAGQRLHLTTKDTGLALAAVRAWNDWHLESWAGSPPSAATRLTCANNPRITKLQLP